MPNVPNLPGVPPLLSFAANTLTLLLTDAIGFLGGLFGPRWGIYLDGVIALEVESVVNFSVKKDYAIADYPVEGGLTTPSSFQSYDKVELAGDIRVRVTSGPDTADRQLLLNDAEAIAATLDLYDIVTPEKVYRSYNVSHYDVQRTAVNGVGMIVCDLWFAEVRQTQAASFTQTPTMTSTQNPTTGSPQGLGNVQPAAPSASVQSSFSSSSAGFPLVL